MGVLPSRRIRLGLTGLARSGKTVFLTSFVHQLLKDESTQISAENALQPAIRLPFLKAIAQRRLVDVSLNDQPHPKLPPFRYERFARSLLSDQPEWPESTSDISFLKLEFEFLSQSKMQRLMGTRRLILEVLDYPGEWLLDLPMMHQSYTQWSHQILQLLEEPLRRPRAAPFLEELQCLSKGRRDPQKLAAKFKEALGGLRYDGFSFLQPGRLVLPGNLNEDDKRLVLAPLPHPEQSNVPAEIYHDFSKTYTRYVNELVKPFYNNHLKGLDRQIVLIDILSSLNSGHAAFSDMQTALKTILKHYQYSKSWLPFFSHRIDRVLFAATKADHVGPHQIPAMRTLLEDVLEDLRPGLFPADTRFKTEAIASLISSEPFSEDSQDLVREWIAGMEVGESDYCAIYPGEVPERLPSGQGWLELEANRKRGEGFAFPRLRPPVLQSRNMPHLNLDRILDFLLEDRLQ